MPKYIVERNVPGVGRLTASDLCGAAQRSCAALSKLGPSIQWVQSYVLADKLHCVYIAPNEKLIRDHAAQSGFPADKITPISTIIDPTTAEPR
jgi:hypothetical protein